MKVFVFAGFCLDPRQRLLFAPDGRSAPLSPRAFDTLLYLVEHPNQLIDKQALMKAVWPNVIVEENNLNQNISIVRRVLGETAGEHRFIVTVPGRGFRFVPTVTRSDAALAAWPSEQLQMPQGLPYAANAAALPSPVPTVATKSVELQPSVASAASTTTHERANARRLWLAGVTAGAIVLVAGLVLASHLLSEPSPLNNSDAFPASSLPVARVHSAEPSIAVLPFVNMSGDKEQEYFSDGLSEEVLNQLAQFPRLRVIGRTSSFAFKGRNEDLRRIGEMLGVNHLLEGSVRKFGNRVHITAQLINPTDGSLLWSATYERTLDDIFAIQEEIARTVAAQLQLRIDGAILDSGGTKNVAAYDEFLIGRALLNSNEGASMLASVPHLEHAVELDATYVPARLWLIDAYTRISLGDARQAAHALHSQDEAIDQIVKLVPGSAEASLALSYRAARQHDLRKMAVLLKESLQVTGGSGIRARLRYGQFLEGVGQTAQAIAELERVKQDDPLDIFARTNLLLAYEIGGESARADTEMQQLLQLPGGLSPALLATAITRAQGRRDIVRLREAMTAYFASENTATSVNAQMQPLLNDPILARRKLRQLATESRFEDGIYEVSGLAQWAAYMGDKDLALAALNAMRERYFTFEVSAFVLWRPVMRDLRQELGFKELLRKWGLVEYWRGTGNWGDFCKPVGNDDFECH